MSDRYISDRFLPDKAIDLIDQAGARIRLRNLGKSHRGVEREDKLAKLTARARRGGRPAENYDRAKDLKAQIDELNDEVATIEERREGAPEGDRERHRGGRVAAHRHPGRAAERGRARRAC